MDAGKTVLLIGSFAPSLVNFRGSLIGEMVRQGHTVVAAAPEPDEKSQAELRKLGAAVRDIPFKNASLDPLSFLQSLRAMRKLIREVRPEVVIAYAIKPVIVSALVGRAERVGAIVSVITGLGYAFTGGREPKRLVSRALASLLYRLALKRSDAIVFLNPDDRATFADLGLTPPNKPAHLLNGEGLDVNFFSPAPLPERTAFLMIARLLKDKGIREFAEAARRLKESHPEVPIALVGFRDSSPDSLPQADLDELIRCGVEFKGRLDDVRPAIRDCSVYVLPSYREGTPRSVLEAMAMGRAIVTTDAPGCRETVRPGENGLLVPVRDSGALYAAMLRFVDEPDLAPAMGAASRRIAEEKYDVAKVNEDLLRFAGLSTATTVS